MGVLTTNISLQYAKQSTIHQLFDTIPRGGDDTLDLSNNQMFHAVQNAIEAVRDIPQLERQTPRLHFLLQASQWEHARAYYLIFYWFNTIGPQLAMTLTRQAESCYIDLKEGTPLQKLARHVYWHVHAIKLTKSKYISLSPISLLT